MRRHGVVDLLAVRGDAAQASNCAIATPLAQENTRRVDLTLERFTRLLAQSSAMLGVNAEKCSTATASPVNAGSCCSRAIA